MLAEMNCSVVTYGSKRGIEYFCNLEEKGLHNRLTSHLTDCSAGDLCRYHQQTLYLASLCLQSRPSSSRLTILRWLLMTPS